MSYSYYMYDFNKCKRWLSQKSVVWLNILQESDADITVTSGGPGKGEHAALSRAGTGAW